VKLPWKRRSERKRDVRAALRQAQRSRQAARTAEKLAAELRQIEGDKLAEAIMEGLVNGEEHG